MSTKSTAEQNSANDNREEYTPPPIIAQVNQVESDNDGWTR